MSTDIIISLVTFLASMIALFGVLTTIFVQKRIFDRQLQSSHALKISEMRQSWINNLRDSMATFQSYGVTPDLSHNKQREFYEAGTKIELMMNPKDPDYEELQSALYEFLHATDNDRKFSANPAYISICQRILKREWENLKNEINAAGSEKSRSAIASGILESKIGSNSLTG